MSMLFLSWFRVVFGLGKTSPVLLMALMGSFGIAAEETSAAVSAATTSQPADSAELAFRPLDEGTARARLHQEDLTNEERRPALRFLAEEQGRDALPLLLELAGAFRRQSLETRGLAALLANLPVAELSAHRNLLHGAAANSTGEPVAAAILAARLRLMDTPGTALREADPEALEEILTALALVDDAPDTEAFFLRIQPFLESVLPGGENSFGESLALQEAAVRLALRSPEHRGRGFSVLARVAKLTSSESLRNAALETMRSVPEGQWPAGLELFPEAGSVDPAKMELGEAVYLRAGLCGTCHQPHGKGMPGAFPPLVNSKWIEGAPERMIKIVIHGLMGAVEIDGEEFNSVMPPQGLILADEELAAVLTYVRNSWGHKAGDVDGGLVKKVREETASRAGMWMVDQILEEHPLP